MKLNKKLIFPFILSCAIYCLSFQIPKFTVSEYRLHYLDIPLDSQIKIWTPMFVIYIGAYVQWAYILYISCCTQTKRGYRYASAIIIGSLIGFITFMVYPTAITRPEVIGNSIFDKFARFIYSIDNIICACPSYHCFFSTIVILFIKDCGQSKRLLYINIFFSILVYISTLLTKQHVLIDIPFGILLAFIAMWISKKVVFTKLFNRLNNFWIKIK